MTRLTNGHSKKLRNHTAAISLHVAYYNFCRVHESLRITPAMALGVTDHIWTIGELIQTALATPPSPEPPAPTTRRPTYKFDREAGLPAGAKPLKLRLIPGGRIGSRKPARRSSH